MLTLCNFVAFHSTILCMGWCTKKIWSNWLPPSWVEVHFVVCYDNSLYARFWHQRRRLHFYYQEVQWLGLLCECVYYLSYRGPCFSVGGSCFRWRGRCLLVETLLGLVVPVRTSAVHVLLLWRRSWSHQHQQWTQKETLRRRGFRRRKHSIGGASAKEDSLRLSRVS